MIVTTPRNMLKLSQSSLFRLGGRIHAEFSGIQSVCSDVTAQTYLTGLPNFSLGCDGSRKFSGITDDEMVMGFPAEMLPEITAALKIVTVAPGSKQDPGKTRGCGGRMEAGVPVPERRPGDARAGPFRLPSFFVPDP
jgi:uncharacterized protein (DUF169 family)